MQKRQGRGSLHDLPPKMVFSAAFLVLTAVLLVLIARLLAPFATALLWAAVLTILVYPVYGWLVRRARMNRTVAASLTTVALALAVLGPASYLAIVLAQESRDVYDLVRRAMSGGGSGSVVDRAIGWVIALLPGFLDESGMRAVEESLRKSWASALSSVSVSVIHGLNRVITDASAFFIKGFVALFAVFYFLKEGEGWLRKLRDTVPLSPDVWALVVGRLGDTLRSVVHGILVSSAILGVALGICFKFTGVPMPALLGVVAFFGANIPFVGPLSVWLPACAWLYFTGAKMGALYLLIWGGVVIFVVDNILRPWIVGSIARLPALFMLVAILGGLVAYGPLGLFLGPVLLAIGLAVGGVYREIRMPVIRRRRPG